MANVVQIVLKGVDQFTGTFKNATRSMADLKAASLSFAAVAATAFAAASSAAVAFTKQAINTADETGKMAQKAGIAVETFSALQHAAELSDVSNETLIKGLKGLSTELVKAGRGSADLNEELLAIADDFANAADGADKTALAVQHFGKAGQDMIPLLNQGSAAIREQMEEAKRFGLVISSGFAANAEQFNDNLTRIGSLFRGLWQQVAEKVLPTFNALLEMFLEFISNEEVMTAVVEAITGAFEVFGEVILAVSEAWITAVGLFNGETWAEIGNKLLALEERFDSAREKFSNLASGGGSKDPLVNQADAAAALVMLEKLIQKKYEVTNADLAAFEAENIRHRESLKNINDLVLNEGQKKNLLLAETELFEARKTQIAEEQAARRVAVERQEAQQRQQIQQSLLGATANLFGSLAGLAAQQGKKGFAAWKAFSIAQAIVSTAAGVARALAEYPFPYSVAIGALVGAAGAVQIATIAGTQPQGQAHGGLENVPREGTYLLSAGERVVQPEQNALLTRFLNNQGSSGGGSRSSEVNIYLDGTILARAIGDMSRDGRLTLDARSIT